MARVRAVPAIERAPAGGGAYSQKPLAERTTLSDVLTFLLIELPPDDSHVTGVAPAAVVQEAVRAAGGTVTDEGAGAGGDATGAHTAVFHIASGAALAAVQVARTLAAAPPRMALCTGDADARSTLGGAARQRAGALLRLTQRRQILVTASTAVMASPALPRQAELVDCGVRALDPTRPPERIYELRPGSLDPGDLATTHDDDLTSSNLEWARRAAHGPVLGREDPLAALEAAWQATLHGKRRTVVLSGEGGIGKTTVAAELALRLHAEGALVLYGRWDPEPLAPYQAMREALGSYASACPTPRLRIDLDGWGDELSRLLPDVGARVGGVRSPLRGDPESERLRLFEAIETWLDRLASRRGLLVVLDDLHWAERSSWLLLDHLRHSPGTAPRMILTTLREGEAGADSFERDSEGLEHVRLGGLDEAVVAQLVEQTLGHTGGPLDDDLVTWLTDGTAGNPLFVQEVLRGVGRSDDTSRALRAARDAVPGRLADVVAWRLKQLPAATSSLLADAALIGPTFDLDLLASARAATPISLQAALDDGVRTGLLQAREPGGSRYAFTHDLVRRALQETREGSESASLHRRIATALANRALAGGEVIAAEVAHHHLLGADYQTIGPAVRWARNAAEAARRETAFETAVNLLGRAIDAHDRFYGIAHLLAEPEAQDLVGSTIEDDVALACELRLELAEAHDRAGEFTARDERHMEAAELARRLDRTDLFVRAALGFGGILPAAAPPNPDASGLLAEALERMPTSDSRSRAIALARYAQVQNLVAPYPERRAQSDEAVAMARRIDAPVVLAQVLMARCLTLDGPEDAEEQVAVGEEITRLGERTADPELVLQGARARMPALINLACQDEASALAETFARLADQVRHPDHLRLARMWRIMRTGLDGRYIEAEAQADQLLDELLAAGHVQGVGIHFVQTFGGRWLHGDLERSRPALEAMKMVFPSSIRFWAISLWLDMFSGEDERARAELAAADPRQVRELPWDYFWWPTVLAWTVVATQGATVGQADREWAAELYDAMEPYRGRNCALGYAAYGGAVDHYLGTLATVLDRHDEAVTLLESGLARHRELEAVELTALSTRWLAHALAARAGPDDVERAGRLLDESLAAERELGLHGLPPAAELPLSR